MPIGVTGCTNLIFEVTFWRNLEASFFFSVRCAFCHSL